jgi:hypothetical protein
VKGGGRLPERDRGGHKPPLYSKRSIHGIRCPVCGKELSIETNNEVCPRSFFKNGKHPIFIVEMPDWAIVTPANRK